MTVGSRCEFTEKRAPVAARSTVAEAIKALEDAGILTWINRIVRVRERCEDLFGHSRVHVIRTSNGYQFNDPKSHARLGIPQNLTLIFSNIMGDPPALPGRQ